MTEGKARPSRVKSRNVREGSGSTKVTASGD
jgi:hypothetical protein